MMADTGEDAAGMMLYVGGLDASVTEALVHAAFIPFGDIKEINMPLDPESSEHPFVAPGLVLPSVFLIGTKLSQHPRCSRR